MTLADLKEAGKFPDGVRKAKLSELLQRKYPEHTWDKFHVVNKYSRQKRLERAVARLFPVSGTCYIHIYVLAVLNAAVERSGHY